MKKIIFGLVATGFIALSSFTTVDAVKKADDANTVPCRWRTVYTLTNGDVAATEWVYGNCNRSESGKLYPIL